MAKGAKLVPVIYADDPEKLVDVLVTLGDSLRAGDWAENEYPYPARPALPETLTLAEQDLITSDYRNERADVDGKREWRAGLYACYLGAKRAGLRGAEGDWLEWLSLVTMPEELDDDPAAEGDQESTPGESDGPASEV